MPHAWYLAADMQLFIFTPFLLLPMWHLKKRFSDKVSLGYCTGILVASLIWILALSITESWSSNSFIPG